MFDEALSKTEIEIGALSEDNFNQFISRKTKNEIDKLAVSILNKLEPPVQFLIDIIENLFSPKFSKYSKIEKLYSPKLTPEVCEIRIRPQNGYYLTLNKIIPRPDNPDGLDACGIEISFSILRGFAVPDKTVFPRLYFHFTIWGFEERKALGCILKNYRRIFELLFKNLDLDFFTSCVFDRLKKIKSKNVFQKLCTYYEQDDDAENTFSLQKTYSYGDNYDDFVNNFIVLAIIYESCLELILKKDQDALLNYYNKYKTV
jgi:hypothetical protein